MYDGAQKGCHMDKKPVMIYGYELTTPKFTRDSYDIDRFDFEILGYYFSRIINEVPLKERAFKDSKRMINLISFKQSDDANLYEGVFTTARYGKEQDILDVLEQVEAGVKPKTHGIKNEVNFIVDSRTGLMLLEKDSERVASGDIIRKFIRYHRDLITDYIVAFNKQKDPIKIHKRSFMKISSLPQKSFFDEIHEFSTIKDAYYYLDISELPATSNEVSNLLYLQNKADENGMKGVTRVKVSFENNVPKESITGVNDYFKKLFESQYFDGLGVCGKLHSGRQRTIELENIQRAFDIQVEFNESGLPSFSDLIEGMSEIALRDNPLEHKKFIDQHKGVVINGDEEEDREVQS